MIKLGEENLKKYIKKIGLYNSKARNIIKLSKILVNKYNSKISLKTLMNSFLYQELAIKLRVYIKM